MAELQAKANSGTQVDPQTLMQGPIVRVAIGAMVVMGVSVLVFMFTMTVLPDMLLEDRRLGPALRRGVAAGARNLLAVIAVSYTHLDVYKRQVRGHAAASCAPSGDRPSAARRASSFRPGKPSFSRCAW